MSSQEDLNQCAFSECDHWFLTVAWRKDYVGEFAYACCLNNPIKLEAMKESESNAGLGFLLKAASKALVNDW